MFLHDLYILRRLCLSNTDRVGSARDTDADIFFPVRSVKTIDPDDPLYAAVIDLLKRMI